MHEVNMHIQGSQQRCSSVKAVDKHFKDRNTGITSQPYSGHQQTASTDRHKGKNR